MAPGVQWKGLNQTATLKTAKTGLKSKNDWCKAGEIAGQKMKALIDARSEVYGKEIMLSFEPMITFKWICNGKVDAGEHKGVFLTCSQDAVNSEASGHSFIIFLRAMALLL